MSLRGDRVPFSEAQIQRYARHILLPEIGGRGQRQLLESAVRISFADDPAAACVALAYLAGAGLGTIVVDDHAGILDEEDVRTGILYGAGDVGQPRLIALCNRVRDITDDVSIVDGDVESAPGSCLRVELGSPEQPADLAGALIRGGQAASLAIRDLVSTR